MKIDENDDREYQLIQKLEDRRYDRFGNTIKTIYGVFSVVVIVVGSLFAYLNATLISRTEYTTLQAAATKDTITLVEKEGKRMSSQIDQVLSPVISQFTDVKNKFEESMGSIATRMNILERQADQTKTEIDKAVFKTEDFYDFEKDNSRSLNAIRDSILLLQTKVAELKSIESRISDRYTKSEQNQYAASQAAQFELMMERDEATNERLESLRRETNILLEAINNRLASLEESLNASGRRK